MNSATPPSIPDITVAVINYNGADSLVPTIKSVFAQEGVRLVKVILADNHSTDQSVAIVRRECPEVLIHELPDNRGPNPARNVGLQLATTERVLIMDNDIVLAPDYISRLAAVFREHPTTGAVSGQIRLHEDPTVIQYNGVDIHYAGEVTSRALTETGTARMACVSAGAVLIDRRKALELGAFDEDFIFGWEDGDLTFRMSLVGFPCYMVSEAPGYHMRRKRGMKWIRYQTRNRWWFILKNYDRRTVFLALPAILFFQLSAGLFLTLKGQLGAFLQGTWEGVTAGPTLREKRAAIMRRKIVSDRDLLRGDRIDLPGGLSDHPVGRILNRCLNALFHGYWLCIRPLLRKRVIRPLGL